MKPPGLREQKKQHTRNMLLTKARELFAHKGYMLVTTSEIAREANIAEGTLFNYFRSKGELFIAAVMPSAAVELEYEPIHLDKVDGDSLFVRLRLRLDLAIYFARSFQL